MIRRDDRHLGLGLFIVNTFVQARRGTMDVHASNEETTFSIRIPQAAEVTRIGQPAQGRHAASLGER